jgi:hypothetical protein
MSAQELLEQARMTGLVVTADGDRLCVRGSRQFADLAQLLIDRKVEILHLLTSRPVHCAIHRSGDGDETSPLPQKTVVSSPGVTDQEWPSRRNEPVCWGRGQTRRLVGNGFPAITPEAAPDAILAIPKAVCPACRVGVVLPELRFITAGRCFPCWEASRR